MLSQIRLSVCRKGKGKGLDTCYSAFIAFSAFIASRVDYCNAVLYGVSAKVTRRLQMVPMPPLALSSALASMTTSRRLFAMFSTGCQYLRELSSTSLFLRSTVSVVLALPTSKMSACRCRILLLGALSVRRSVVTCLFLEQEQ